MPKVSICIPAYNQPSNLRRALESVFIQTFTDYEVIVTDDSPDNSVGLVAEEFRQRIDIRYYKNKTRKGSPENWNEAVRMSSGEYIKILHHDDWFPDENCLTDFVKMLDLNPMADFAFCPSRICDADRNLLYVNMMSETQINILHTEPRVLFQGNFIGAPSATIYRRQINQEFDRRLKWLVDIEFYLRILANNRDFGYSMRPLICTASESLEGRVTDEGLGNKQVEVFEYLYLYTRISKDRPLDYRLYRVIWALFDRFNVQSSQEIFDCGVDFALPHEVNDILLFRRIYKRAGRRLASAGMAVFFLYLKLTHFRL